MCFVDQRLIEPSFTVQRAFQMGLVQPRASERSLVKGCGPQYELWLTWRPRGAPWRRAPPRTGPEYRTRPLDEFGSHKSSSRRFSMQKPRICRRNATVLSTCAGRPSSTMAVLAAASAPHGCRCRLCGQERPLIAKNKITCYKFLFAGLNAPLGGGTEDGHGA